VPIVPALDQTSESDEMTSPKSSLDFYPPPGSTAVALIGSFPSPIVTGFSL